MNDARPFDHVPDYCLSPKTVRGYQIAWNGWVKYCKQVEKPTLPIDPNLLCDYLEYLIKIGYKHQSILTSRWSLVSSHKFNNLGPVVLPVGRYNEIIARSQARRHQSKQAPILYHKNLIQILDNPTIKPKDKAIVSMMFDGLLRRSDLLEIRWKDVFLKENEEGQVKGFVRIYKTKTKFYTDGHVRALSEQTILWLEEWYNKKRAGYKKKPEDKIFPFQVLEVSQAFKRISIAVGIKFTTHSARVGATTEMINAGISSVDIANAAGWSNLDMVRMYARHQEAEQSGMATFLDKKNASREINGTPLFIQHTSEIKGVNEPLK